MRRRALRFSHKLRHEKDNTRNVTIMLSIICHFIRMFEKIEKRINCCENALMGFNGLTYSHIFTFATTIERLI